MQHEITRIPALPWSPAGVGQSLSPILLHLIPSVTEYFPPGTLPTSEQLC